MYLYVFEDFFCIITFYLIFGRDMGYSFLLNTSESATDILVG